LRKGGKEAEKRISVKKKEKKITSRGELYTGGTPVHETGKKQRGMGKGKTHFGVHRTCEIQHVKRYNMSPSTGRGQKKERSGTWKA